MQGRALRRLISNRRLAQKDKRLLAEGLLTLAVLVATGITISERYYMLQSIEPSRYSKLLDTIAKGESNGNYNAYFGNSSNSSIRFTDMTIGQVLQWQAEYVQKGSPSSAVGKYQFMPTTLRGLMQERDIDQTARFDEKLQDELAIALLERRGAREFVANKLPREQFAANLAKEWAALPMVLGPNPQQSYYAGDGLNKVQISIDEVYQALDTLDS